MTTPSNEDEKYWETFLSGIRAYAPGVSLTTDKRDNELGCVRQLFELLPSSPDCIKSRGEGEDPPDCEAIWANGERIGIEVTELVCQQIVAHEQRDLKKRQGILSYCGAEITNERERPDFWSDSEVVEKINWIIAKKDKTDTWKGGSYSAGWLLIVTDDPLVSDHRIIERVYEENFGPARSFDKVFYLEIGFNNLICLKT